MRGDLGSLNFELMELNFGVSETERRIITHVIGPVAGVGRINAFPTNCRTCPRFSGGGSAELLAHLPL